MMMDELAMRGRRILTLMLALGTLAIVVAAAFAVAPRVGRAIALHRTIEAATHDTGTAREAALAELAAREEPEALLALVELFRAEPTGQIAAPLMNAFELYACSPLPRDQRPRAAIEAMARDPSSSVWQRFGALYIVEELDEPTFPIEPEDVITPRGGSYRGFVRAAQSGENGVVIEGGRARLVPGFGWQSFGKDDPALLLVDFEKNLGKKIVVVPPAAITLPPRAHGVYRFGSLKSLRALAALNGCRVRERDAQTLEIV